MEIPERIWHLMAKALNSEASPEESEELSVLLKQDDEVQQQFELLSRIWKEKGQGVDDDGNARKLILKIIDKAQAQADSEHSEEERLNTRRRSRRRRMFSITAAAAAFFIITAGWFFWNNQKTDVDEAKKPETLVVNKGSRSRFLLSDGTTVWLNAGSKLFYESDFSGATREVRLEGEAFFDVIKNPKKPFIVHASSIDIRVLGTAFNVKSYPEDKNVETTLYRGLVNVVRTGDPAKKIIRLIPNQKLVLPKQAANESENLSEKITLPTKASPGSFTITHIDSTKKESERFETAWLYSRLEFRGDSFEELALKLERWYNVTISFTDEKVKQLTVTGSFENETVEQAMAALKEAFPINYKISDHEIFIGSSQ
ncbi:FecR family protein [Terrimonas alba]|uniref:FecR family protein n=1 Tax=Terrimonas alba TaxID=3349636 RepID=UPI0035F36305